VHEFPSKPAFFPPRNDNEYFSIFKRSISAAFTRFAMRRQMVDKQGAAKRLQPVVDIAGAKESFRATGKDDDLKVSHGENKGLAVSG
jgi:hypothetical protein